MHTLAHHAYALLRLLRGRTARFTEDYAQNSGAGSDLASTARLIEQLPPLFRELQIRSLLDLPCGDFLWMQRVDLTGITYTGGDIIDTLIASHQHRYAASNRTFRRLDLVTDPLPTVDLVFCRDCLVHLSNRLVHKAIDNITRSGSTYLVSTTFPGRENRRIVTGHWRPVDLCAPPFNFPTPLTVISEGTAEPYADKSLGVWRIADL